MGLFNIIFLSSYKAVILVEDFALWFYGFDNMITVLNTAT